MKRSEGYQHFGRLDQLPQWRLLWSVAVLGIPKGQPRGAATSRGGKPRIYTPNTAENWKSCIADEVRDLLSADPLDETLRLEIDFFMKRPKSLCRRKDPDGPLRCPKEPDWDNLGKAVCDALEQIGVYNNDKLIAEGEVRKFYHRKGGRPGAIIALYAESDQ